MEKRHLQIVFFLSLLILAVFISYQVFRPYLNVLVLAGTLSVICQPLYRRLLKLVHHENVAATIMVAVVVILILLPLGYFVLSIFSEATALYASLSSHGGFDFGIAINRFLQSNFPGLLLPEFTVNFNESIQRGLVWFIQNVGSLFSGVAQVLFVIFLSLMGLFYFLKEGKRLQRWLINILPLEAKYTEEILSEMATMVNSVVIGTLTIAVLQGLVAGLSFFLFNIPNPAFWAALVIVSSLIPIIGTWLVVAPAIAYLFFTGQTVLSVSLAVWSIILINFIYNVLSPQLMHRGNNIHPFIILLSVLGGLVTFGPIGFLVGPLVMALLFSLINIYSKLILKRAS